MDLEKMVESQRSSSHCRRCPGAAEGPIPSSSITGCQRFCGLLQKGNRTVHISTELRGSKPSVGNGHGLPKSRWTKRFMQPTACGNAWEYMYSAAFRVAATTRKGGNLVTPATLLSICSPCVDQTAPSANRPWRTRSSSEISFCTNVGSFSFNFLVPGLTVERRPGFADNDAIMATFRTDLVKVALMDFRSPSGCPAPVALVAPAVVAEAAEGLPALPGLPAPSANEILGASTFSAKSGAMAAASCCESLQVALKAGGLSVSNSSQVEKSSLTALYSDRDEVEVGDSGASSAGADGRNTKHVCSTCRFFCPAKHKRKDSRSGSNCASSEMCRFRGTESDT
mmetsp:Transcript_67503/g.136791  ORF Transcript_67503/g.136791 Transcript_67503/m.136791 type:complete len:340 (+) Transcript_67503:129-1148(+)